MKRAVLVALTSAFIIGGCAIGIGHHGDLIIVPALPVTVEVDDNSYYYQNGYYYWYQNDAWLYSESREGPWHNLPRDRWSREVHRRGQEGHDDHGDHGDNDRDRGHDRDLNR